MPYVAFSLSSCSCDNIALAPSCPAAAATAPCTLSNRWRMPSLALPPSSRAVSEKRPASDSAVRTAITNAASLRAEPPASSSAKAANVSQDTSSTRSMSPSMSAPTSTLKMARSVSGPQRRRYLYLSSSVWQFRRHSRWKSPEVAGADVGAAELSSTLTTAGCSIFCRVPSALKSHAGAMAPTGVDLLDGACRGRKCATDTMFLKVS
mmetsp:Transcript_36414/g.93057  ORF Transcript_36414/g.93057 Transcript_36414/m.93057 type:complete len:207 (+) Transcript_36414:567-1187(+)